ncbi:DUF84 family protein [Vibrio sp. S11_S32]|uniref:DUF84 family protein n=1 Tax=Vibrio sp. S11_S32 TaxID=2720225 RepID=UPI00168163EE|nr:inosine/xanthosine triphosphatase [Vibrio sp. S11_S32]MBD1576794.1 DUF84 family protein [Vibrio sp. S11_S32]
MQNKQLSIALCSNNEAKVSAARGICSELYANFSFIHHNVSSGVSETPETDEEAIQGCHVRIENMENNYEDKFDFIIALEGLIEKKSFGSFVYGWAVIKNIKNNQYYYGCSGKVMLPKIISSRLSRDIKLSDIVLEAYPSITKSNMDKLGTNGVLTNGLYTRVHEFETALKCAFGSVSVDKSFS